MCHVWCYCCRAVLFKYASIKSLVKRQIVTKYLSSPRNQKQCWALLLNTLFLKAELTLEYPEASSKGNKSIRLFDAFRALPHQISYQLLKLTFLLFLFANWSITLDESYVVCYCLPWLWDPILSKNNKTATVLRGKKILSLNSLEICSEISNSAFIFIVVNLSQSLFWILSLLGLIYGLQLN